MWCVLKEVHIPFFASWQMDYAVLYEAHKHLEVVFVPNYSVYVIIHVYDETFTPKRLDRS